MYSYKKTLVKGIKYFILFLLPVLVDHFIVAFPEIAQLSVGGILVMGYNWLKIKAGVKLL